MKISDTLNMGKIVTLARRWSWYLIQKSTGWGIEHEFEQLLRSRAETYLRDYMLGRNRRREYPVTPLRSFDLSDTARFSLHRDDIYRRFRLDDGGTETDRFARRGEWVPRGCTVYHDRKSDTYVKIFDPWFSQKGEGRFLRDALDGGFYDFLCPGLRYLIEDSDGVLRGYGILAGRQLTPYEFERYVGHAFQDLIIALTESTGLYLSDLVFHNVVRIGDELCLIDLESVLPVEWYGEDLEFARRHLPEVDIGWPLQEKWRSPRWYGQFLQDLKNGPKTSE